MGNDVSTYPAADDCAFCGRIDRHEYDYGNEYAVVFEPLNPVTPGHLLVVSRSHIIDALYWPHVTGHVMAYAALIARRPCNLITSCGAEATQTIKHLHIHIVPRREGDGLLLPWSPRG
jgi:histidine triad (HIT) family protein